VDKCQVKGCENEAGFFVCDHEVGDKNICVSCVDKYYTNKRPCDCISCKCEREAMQGSDLCLECTVAESFYSDDNSLRERVSIIIGLVLVYFSITLEVIYGRKNYQKIDEMLCKFFDLFDREDEKMFSNAQSYDDIP